MSDMISKGLTWFQNMRQLHCSQEILIGFDVGTATPIRATVSSDEATSTQNRITLQKVTFHFVVRRIDLEENSIKLHRGLKIWYKGDTYEVAFEHKDIYEYNDPNRLDIILKTVLTKDSNGLTPTYKPS